MWRAAFVSACAAALAAVGFFMGSVIHGQGPAALVPVAAGGAGGLGIGCAALDVLRRWRAAREAAAKV